MANLQVNASVDRLPLEVDSIETFRELRNRWTQGDTVPLIYESSSEAPSINFPGQDTRLLVSGEQSAGRFAIFEVTVLPGFGAPHHHQPNEDEWWYVLEGEIEIGVGDQVRTVRAGASAYSPAKCSHTFANKTNAPVRMITVNSPAGHERFFEALMNAAEKTDEERRVLTANHDVVFGERVVMTQEGAPSHA